MNFRYPLRIWFTMVYVHIYMYMVISIHYDIDL